MTINGHYYSFAELRAIIGADESMTIADLKQAWRDIIKASRV